MDDLANLYQEVTKAQNLGYLQVTNPSLDDLRLGICFTLVIRNTSKFKVGHETIDKLFNYLVEKYPNLNITRGGRTKKSRIIIVSEGRKG